MHCVPTCSFPLNTYNLQPTDGLRASGGSWYLSTVLVPSPCLTVFVAAASKPEGLKLGFALSSAESSGFDAERERPWELRPRGDADRREGPGRASRSLSRSRSLYPLRSLSRERSRSGLLRPG